MKLLSPIFIFILSLLLLSISLSCSAFAQESIEKEAPTSDSFQRLHLGIYEKTIPMEQKEITLQTIETSPLCLSNNSYELSQRQYITIKRRVLKWKSHYIVSYKEVCFENSNPISPEQKSGFLWGSTERVNIYKTKTILREDAVKGMEQLVAPITRTNFCLSNPKWQKTLQLQKDLLQCQTIEGKKTCDYSVEEVCAEQKVGVLPDIASQGQQEKTYTLNIQQEDPAVIQNVVSWGKPCFLDLEKIKVARIQNKMECTGGGKLQNCSVQIHEICKAPRTAKLVERDKKITSVGAATGKTLIFLWIAGFALFYNLGVI